MQYHSSTPFFKGLPFGFEEVGHAYERGKNDGGQQPQHSPWLALPPTTPCHIIALVWCMWWVGDWVASMATPLDTHKGGELVWWKGCGGLHLAWDVLWWVHMTLELPPLHFGKY